MSQKKILLGVISITDCAALPKYPSAIATPRSDPMTQAVNTDPRHGKAGRQPTKENLHSFSDNADPGLFGKIFDLPAFAPPEAALKALADAMLDASPSDASGDNPNIPSGFTY